LPLSGGTLTGDLTLDGTLLFPGQTRMYANTADPDWNGLRGRVNDTEAFDFYDAVHPNSIYRSLRVAAHGDGNGDLVVEGYLQVDGQVNAAVGTPAAPSYSFAGGAGSSDMGMYKHANNQIAFSSAGAKVLTLHTTGVFAYTPFKGQAGDANAPTYSWEANPYVGFYLAEGVNDVGLSGNLKVSAEIHDGLGPLRTYRFVPDVDTQDVLDRAEVATMPAPDDEGVATADVESLTVNEVVTAMLAKIKELSAEIKELKGA